MLNSAPQPSLRGFCVLSAPFMQLPAIAPGKRFALPRPIGSADALLLARHAAGACGRRATAVHRRRRPGGRAAPGRRTAVLRAGIAHRGVPGLGDAALRQLLAAPGPDLRAPGHAVAGAIGRRGRGAAARHHRADTPGAARLHGRLHLPLPAEDAAQRGRAEGAADAGRLQPRQPGGVARRVRGARRADRPVPDGLAGAVPRGPVRRRGRFDPHLRPRHAAQPVPGARGAAAARARVPDGRGGAQRLSRALARDRSKATRAGTASTRTSAPASPPPASSTTCRCSSRRDGPTACSTTSGRRERGAARCCTASSNDALQHFWTDTRERHRFLRHDPERPILPPEALFLRRRGLLHPRQRARHAAAARQWRNRLGPPAARRERRARRDRAAGRAGKAPRHHAAPGAAGGRERGPAREPARAAARPPHRRAERGDAGRVRGRRRKVAIAAAPLAAGFHWHEATRDATARLDPVHHRDRALRHHAAGAAPPQAGTDQQRRCADQGPVGAEDRRPGGALAARHRPLPGAEEHRPRRRRRRRQRVPAPGIRRQGHAVRAGVAAAPDQPLHRASAPTKRHCTGSAAANGTRPGARPPNRCATPPPSC